MHQTVVWRNNLRYHVAKKALLVSSTNAPAIIDQYTADELKNIILHSSSYSEALRKLGYSTNKGSNLKILKDRMEKYAIDASHFSINKRPPTKRSFDNIFIENSTASHKTMRTWYIKGQYSKYECSICGLKPIWQNQPLTLILDHINGRNNDHRLENLRWVCPNCNQQLDTTGFKAFKAKERTKRKKKYYCIDCGTRISDGATRCFECYKKYKELQAARIPHREDLKRMIRTMSFSEIGREFNVSDNTIKKWCKKRNLPHLAREIRTMSNEEWDQV